MGYNRGGKRRTDRLKRAKRHLERLASKPASAASTTTARAEPKPASAPSSDDKVKTT
jgi:hypothetical protein